MNTEIKKAYGKFLTYSRTAMQVHINANYPKLKFSKLSRNEMIDLVMSVQFGQNWAREMTGLLPAVEGDRDYNRFESQTGVV